MVIDLCVAPLKLFGHQLFYYYENKFYRKRLCYYATAIDFCFLIKIQSFVHGVFGHILDLRRASLNSLASSILHLNNLTKNEHQQYENEAMATDGSCLL